MNVVIIKYNAGNTQSLSFALNRLGITPEITDDPEKILSADKVIFPGVGEARSAMDYLEKTSLSRLIPVLTQPFLGICLGLQLMCRYSEERNTPCLGIFDIEVKRFQGHQKIPHMGWNTLDIQEEHPLITGIARQSYMYFVHSYYADLCENTVTQTNYMQPFSSILHKENFYAVQSHPEKSGKTGAIILQNFIELVS